MLNKDQLFRFIFEKLDIRGELITLDDSWQEVTARHDYPESVQQQLGEAMAATAILSSTIKFDGSLILQVQGDGPLNTLVTQASSQGSLCGLAKWKQTVPLASLAEVYGKGRMVITIRNQHAEPYQSVVGLEGNNLSSALEHYFAHSEQLRSRFWLFVSKEKVAGLFLQELPSQINSPAQRQLDWERVTMLANTASAEELFSLEQEDVLHRLYHEEEIRIFEPKQFKFECGCSNRKIESSLIALGRQTLDEILEDEGKIDVDCEFCNQHYQFSADNIEQLFSSDEDKPILH